MQQLITVSSESTLFLMINSHPYYMYNNNNFSLNIPYLWNNFFHFLRNIYIPVN